MKTPKIRELGEAIRALIKGPYTTKFPYAPSPAASRFRGVLKCDSEKCMGCGACAEVCPADSRKIEDVREKEVRKVIYLPDKCIFCGQCETACPSEALKHITEYDIANLTRNEYTETLEKELLFCERCGEIITTKQHLLWIAKKVDELAYSNPTLWLSLARELNVVELDLPTEQAGKISAEDKPNSDKNFYPYRSGHIARLCPVCRRKVWLHEIWGY